MAYYQIVQQSRWKSIIAIQYDSKLWGVIVLDGDIVVGGWVGWLRGNGRFVSLLAKVSILIVILYTMEE